MGQGGNAQIIGCWTEVQHWMAWVAIIGVPNWCVAETTRRERFACGRALTCRPSSPSIFTRIKPLLSTISWMLRPFLPMIRGTKSMGTWYRHSLYSRIERAFCTDSSLSPLTYKTDQLTLHQKRQQREPKPEVKGWQVSLFIAPTSHWLGSGSTFPKQAASPRKFAQLPTPTTMRFPSMVLWVLLILFFLAVTIPDWHS